MSLNKHEYDGDGAVTTGNGPDQPRAPRHGLAMQADGRLRIFVPGCPDRVTVDPIPHGTSTPDTSTWAYRRVRRTGRTNPGGTRSWTSSTASPLTSAHPCPSVPVPRGTDTPAEGA